MTGYDNMTVISEMGFFPSERDFERMLKGDVFWDPMVKDALHKLEQGITDEQEVYRVFRSEIDYLSEEYEGVEELAARVKDVVAGRAESMVDRTNRMSPTQQDEDKLVIASEMEAELSRHSIRTAAAPSEDELINLDMTRYDYEDD